MKKIILCIIIACYTISIFSSPVWKKTQEVDGVLTFQESDGSKILRVKGVVIVNAALDITGNLFRDIPKHDKWLGYCEYAKILKVINLNHYIFYEIMTPPWPVSKRDLVAEATSEYYNEKLFVTIESHADSTLLPENKDYIRIKKLVANISMEYIGPQKTGISYEILLDPAGDIPGFINNIFNQSYIFQTMKNLKATLDDKNYVETLSQSPDAFLVQQLLKDDKILENTLRDRLSRYIRSEENINLLVDDSLFFNKWKNNENRIAEILFFGFHDKKYSKLAVQSIMEAYLDRFSLSKEDLYKLVNNPQINLIFTSKPMKGILTEDFIQNQISG